MIYKLQTSRAGRGKPQRAVCNVLQATASFTRHGYAKTLCVAVGGPAAKYLFSERRQIVHKHFGMMRQPTDL